MKKLKINDKNHQSKLDHFQKILKHFWILQKIQKNLKIIQKIQKNPPKKS